MSLIKVKRHRKEDIQHWDVYRNTCELVYELEEFKRKVNNSKSIIHQFLKNNSVGYIGCSWGKDSTSVSFLVNEVLDMNVPVIWVKPKPIFNPHCELVCNEYLDRFDSENYYEIEVQCKRIDGRWMIGNAMEKGFRKARKKFGEKYISGIRADESSDRKRRDRVFGAISKNTCAPLNNWSSKDVFGFLLMHNLPIHPAYAMNMGGIIDTDRIRVSSLGITNGAEFGKKRWDMEYYPEEMKSLGHYDDSTFIGNAK